MRIIRFIDEKGSDVLGKDRGDGTAEVLDGGLFGPLKPGGRVATVQRLLAPLSPVNILCIGLNYREHIKESDSSVPDNPVLFMKPTTAIAHPGDPIRIPACSRHGPEVDYEGELAVVIGKTARNVPVERAHDHVLGYTAANDVSARKWQRNNGSQWIRGKGFDTFCPLGPALVTADEIPDPQRLRVRTLLNGTVMQDSSTSYMIFPVARLVSFLSEDTTLLPGTVILTGTPPGVGFARNPPVFLKPGDRVTVEVEKIGSLTNPVE